MNEIKKIYLDYQSRSSVALLKYLLKEYWGINRKLCRQKMMITAKK
jgi:chorismate dehydratase